MARKLTAGGTIPKQAEYLYIERPADKLVYERLLRGNFCALLAPRQVGKSSLQLRVGQRLAAEVRFRCLNADLTEVTPAEPIAQNFFLSLLHLLGNEAPEICVPDDFRWNKQGAIWSQFCKILENSLLVQGAPNTVIFLDEVQMVLGYSRKTNEAASTGQELFGALWNVIEHFQRRLAKTREPFLVFCIAGTAAPEELRPASTNRRRNTGIFGDYLILLNDFSKKEVEHFLPSLEDVDPHAEDLLDAVYYWTDGHPYMTQRLCLELRAQSKRPLLEPGAVSVEACRDVVRQIVDKAFSSIEGDPLLGDAAKSVLDWAPVQEKDPRTFLDRCLTEYQSILRGSKRVRSQNNFHVQLRIAGLIKEGSGDRHVLSIRNRIFAKLFDERWIEKEKGRPQPRLWAGRSAEWAQTQNAALLLRDRELVEAVRLVESTKSIAEAEQDQSLLADAGLGAEEKEFILASLAAERTRFLRRIVLFCLALLVGIGVVLVLLKDLNDNSNLVREAAAHRQTEIALARLQAQHPGHELRAMAKSVELVHAIRSPSTTPNRRWDRWLHPPDAPQPPLTDWAAMDRWLRERQKESWEVLNPTQAFAPTADDRANAVRGLTNSLAAIQYSLPLAGRSTPARDAGPAPASAECNGFEVQSAAISPDGRWAVTGHRDCKVRLWALETYRANLVYAYDEHARVVNTVSFVSAAGPQSELPYVLTGSADGEAHLLKIQAIEESPESSPGKAAEPKLRLVRIQKLIDRSIASAESRGTSQDPSAVKDSLWVVQPSPDGSRIVTFAKSGMVGLWRRQTDPKNPYQLTGEPCPRASGGPPASAIVRGAAFTSESSRLLTVGRNGAQLWTVNPLCPERPLIQENTVDVGVFVPGEAAVLFASENRLGLLPLPTSGADSGAPRWLPPPAGRRHRFTAIAFLPYEKNLFVTADDSGGLKIWSLSMHPPVPPTAEIISELYGHTAAINSVNFQPGGTQMITASDDGTARLWRLPSRQEPALAGLAPKAGLVLLLQRDGQLTTERLARNAVVGEKPKVLQLVSPALPPSRSGVAAPLAAPAPAPAVEVRQMEIAAEGNRALILDQRRNTYLIDVAAKQQTKIIAANEHEALVRAIAISPSGTLYATLHELSEETNPDQRYRVSVYSDAPSPQLLFHRDFVTTVEFAADDTHILTTSQSTIARIWTLGDPEPVKLANHTHWVTCGAFSAQSDKVATGDRDGKVYVWTLQGQQLFDKASGGSDNARHSHKRAVTRIAFSPDGAWLASASQGGVIYLSTPVGDSAPQRLSTDEDPIRWLSFDEDSSQLLALGQSDTVYLWNLPAPSVSTTPLASAAPAPSPQLVAQISADLRGRKSAVLAAGFVGNELITVHQDGLIGRFPRTLDGYLERACCLLDAVPMRRGPAEHGNSKDPKEASEAKGLKDIHQQCADALEKLARPVSCQ